MFPPKIFIKTPLVSHGKAFENIIIKKGDAVVCSGMFLVEGSAHIIRKPDKGGRVLVSRLLLLTEGVDGKEGSESSSRKHCRFRQHLMRNSVADVKKKKEFVWVQAML